MYEYKSYLDSTGRLKCSENDIATASIRTLETMRKAISDRSFQLMAVADTDDTLGNELNQVNESYNAISAELHKRGLLPSQIGKTAKVADTKPVEPRESRTSDLSKMSRAGLLDLRLRLIQEHNEITHGQCNDETVAVADSVRADLDKISEEIDRRFELDRQM